MAILSLHSHRDRSFLDDVRLHHVSGGLAAAGFDNELVVGLLPPGDDAAFARLVEVLRRFPTVVYERVWSTDVVRRLREALPGALLVRLVGEHALDGAPSDAVCRNAEPAEVVALIAKLTGQAARGPLPRYAPNVQPLYVDDAARPASPSFPLTGNLGCPWQTDARENPRFAGVELPAGMGRGCAFCTTGNHYDFLPRDAALGWVLEQLEYVRARAPELTTLVLRDQNPFYYLTELVEAAEAKGLGPFTLLIESRADWWLNSTARFERALEAAKRSSIRIAPFLVGVENFSQAELDRFNKGLDAAVLVRFLAQLKDWHARWPEAMDLSHGAFGFILFTPWTTLDDLAENLARLRETKLHDFRGHVLLSRARLYPDTALFYLAKKDGLLVDDFARPADDSSARYGYLPAQPWRFVDPRAAKVAELAQAMVERHGGRDELRLLDDLLRLVREAGDPSRLTVDDAERAFAASAPAGRRDDTARLKLAAASALVGAPKLPVDLPMFGLRLLDVEADGDGVVLVLGTGAPVARVRIAWDAQRSAADVRAVAERGDEDAWTATLDVICQRLAAATTRERFERAMGPARQLARTR